jgi:hypothetical protein
MTSDGVDGTAADGRAGAGSCDRPFIKRDDGRLAPRYIEPAYPHTPAGGAVPHRHRRELQVASALRNRSDFMIASLTLGAAGPAGSSRRKGRSRLRPPRHPIKGLR